MGREDRFRTGRNQKPFLNKIVAIKGGIQTQRNIVFSDQITSSMPDSRQLSRFDPTGNCLFTFTCNFGNVSQGILNVYHCHIVLVLVNHTPAKDKSLVDALIKKQNCREVSTV